MTAERSTDGKPLFGRNLDFNPHGFLDKFGLIVVYRQDGKRPFASVTYPGVVGVVTGMNDAGLTLAVHEVRLARRRRWVQLRRAVSAASATSASAAGRRAGCVSTTAATSGTTARAGNEPTPSLQRSSTAASSASSAQPRRAGAIPTRTPPSTPLSSAGQSESVSARNAPGSAASLAERARRRQPGRDARGQVGDPEHRLVGRRNREGAERAPVQERDQVGEGGRVELQLGIAQPPPGVPDPGRRPQRHDVPGAIELAGMIVQSDRGDAECRGGEGEAVGDEQEQGPEGRRRARPGRLTCHGG